MNNILDKIVVNKRIEVEQQKQAAPLDMLLAMGGDRLDRPTLSMRNYLSRSSSGIIAEFKRKSPSKGWLYPNAQIEKVIPAYEDAGACACSILTDSLFFGGSLGDLHKARTLAGIPLLRKDFIIDPYQLYQARIMGADAILLIAACLTPEDCKLLAEKAHSLQLEVLLEIHNEEELSYLNSSIDMLGINNRDLATFHTDISTSFRLKEKIDQAIGEEDSPLCIAESGLADPETVVRLRTAGFRGFLIGETFMKTTDPGNTLSDFIGGIV